MSIFSKIKGAKKAATKHKQELAKHNPDTPVPYKHIPTHAAVDALSGAPSSWREEDRSAIKAQHKRRSMMPRNDSGTSTLKRNSSYNNSSYSSSSTYHGSDVGLAPAMTMRLESRRSYIANPIHQPSPLATQSRNFLPKILPYLPSNFISQGFLRPRPRRILHRHHLPVSHSYHAEDAIAFFFVDTYVHGRIRRNSLFGNPTGIESL